MLGLDVFAKFFFGHFAKCNIPPLQRLFRGSASLQGRCFVQAGGANRHAPPMCCSCPRAGGADPTQELRGASKSPLLPVWEATRGGSQPVHRPCDTARLLRLPAPCLGPLSPPWPCVSPLQALHPAPWDLCNPQDTCIPSLEHRHLLLGTSAPLWDMSIPSLGHLHPCGTRAFPWNMSTPSRGSVQTPAAFPQHSAGAAPGTQGHFPL